MNNLMKLGFSVGLAAAAGILNLVYLNSKDKPLYYLALNDGVETIKAGETFSSHLNDYKAIAVAGDPQRQRTSLIPYDAEEGGSLIYGAKASRDVAAGAPIFFSDIAFEPPSYEPLGPFKLLTVGDRFTGTFRPEDSGRGTGAVLTIQPEFETGSAVEYDEQTRRLLQILDIQSRGESDAPSHLRIVQVIAHPRSRMTDAPVEESPVFNAEQAIFVPIQSSSVSGVLEIGTEVSFLVPKYP